MKEQYREKDTGGSRDTHTGHEGAQGHTDHTNEPHNHPNPPTHNPHVSATTEAAADSTAQCNSVNSRRPGP